MIDITKRSVLELITKDIKNHTDVEELLNENSPDENIDIPVNDNDIRKRSARGFLYERLWDICIKFGVVDILTKKPIEKEIQTSHVFGNPNKDNVMFKKEIKEIQKFLGEKIQSGNSGGYSDITFINKENKDIEILYLISVKYFEIGHSIDKYDIGKLCTLIEKHKKKNREIKLYLLVKDKQKLVSVLKKAHSSSDIMIKYINPNGNYENILELEDLKLYYNKLRVILEQYNYLQTQENIKEFNKYLGVLKEPFVPRFHQHLFIDKINNLLEKDKKNILVGAIPRSGKTYIMGGTILEFIKRNKNKKHNFLLITPAPSETFPEYEKLFTNFNDFDKNDLVYHEYSKKKLNIDKTHNNVIIVSKQRLGWTENPDKTEELKNIKTLFNQELKIDLIFLDEAHFGMTTKNAQEILTQINDNDLGGNCPKIFVTATYKKPQKTYKIDNDSKLTWDINDINIMKTITNETIKDNEIRTRFGKILYDDIVKNYSIKKLKENYTYYPKPYLITTVWDSDYALLERGKIRNTDYGFDMEKLFTINKNGEFENKEQLKFMFEYYFGVMDTKDKRDTSYKLQSYVKNNGILPRISKICVNNCRTLQQQNKPTTQLWFLPYGVGRKINDVSVGILKLLTEDNNYKFIRDNYYFYVAVDNKKSEHKEDLNHFSYMKNPREIKKEIQDIETDIKDGKINQNNLIILAGNRLQLGISLENVDIVTLWNNITSTDAIFQMLFRSMTEVKTPHCKDNNYCPEKKYGFMVDLNPQRALTNLFLFKENLVDKVKKQDSEYKAIGDLINIDNDILKERFGNDEKSKEQFGKELFDKLYDSWGHKSEKLRGLIKTKIKFDDEILNTISRELSNIDIAEEKQTKLQLNTNNNISISKGKKTIKISNNNGNYNKNKTKKKKTIDIHESASEVLAEYLSLLNIFSLYNEEKDVFSCFIDGSSEKNIDNIKYNIESLNKHVFDENEDTFLRILHERLGGSKGGKYSKEVLNKILTAIKQKDDKPFLDNIMRTKKKKFYEYTIENYDELLGYINDNLTPKDKERKERGEVFTPMSLVSEMLDKLPNEVWSNPEYKWLDPAVGIGNFPIEVYKRLMEGLKSFEPNEEKRRKHILENMLYMIDISKKNIFILKKVFCGHKYTLNVHEGSFFGIDKNGEDDYKSNGKWAEQFNIDKFDVIMGNPPYNKNGTGTGGGTFWKYFVELSLNLLNNNGFLNFVHPLGWRKPVGERASGGDILESFKKEGHLIYVNISDIKIPNFPAVDYYVFKKEKKTNYLTNVYNKFKSFENTNTINLGGLHFIPNLVSDKSIRILNKLIKKGNNFSFEYNQKLKPNKTHTKSNGIPHAFYYNINLEKYKEVFLSNQEVLDSYSTKNNKQLDLPEFYSNPKIVLTFKSGNKPSYLYPVYYSKPIGVTNNTMYTEIETKYQNKYLKFFNSKLILFLMKISQYSSSPNHINEQKIINLINKDNFDRLPNNPTDQDIYDYYGITKEEQQLIEDVVKDDVLKTKKTKKANNNKIPHNNNKTKKQPNYVINSPPKIINVNKELIKPINKIIETIPKQMTINDNECIIPFTFKDDKKYDACLDENNNGIEICPTQVSKTGKYKKYEQCTIELPSQEQLNKYTTGYKDYCFHGTSNNAIKGPYIYTLKKAIEKANEIPECTGFMYHEKNKRYSLRLSNTLEKKTGFTCYLKKNVEIRFINDPTIETNQERRELGRRQYEDKKKTKKITKIKLKKCKHHKTEESCPDRCKWSKKKQKCVRPKEPITNKVGGFSFW